jgi:amidase
MGDVALATQLTGRTAVELAGLVRGGQAKPVEVVQAHLDVIERLDPGLNAFRIVRAEKALAEARELEGRDLAILPLAGVPVAIKDEMDVAGEPTRLGSAATPDTPAANDGGCVRRLRDAGAVVVGKTNMPEFGIISHGVSTLHGVTRNPWNPGRTTGGSSAGTAAAVASGMVPIGLGADGGGSIRIPAACCGLFGIKPGDDVVPDGGHWLGLTVFGPLATTVADAALMLSVLAGDGDLAEAPQQRNARFRVAVSYRSPVIGTRLSREMRKAVEVSAAALASAGHAVVEDDPPYSLPVTLEFLNMYIQGIAEDVDSHDADRVEPENALGAKLGRLAQRLRAAAHSPEPRFRARMETWFERHDLLLMPVLTRAAPPIGFIDRKGFVARTWALSEWMPYNPPWNLAQLPAASVPAGFDGDGMPLGVQLIGRPGSEATVLAAAAELERMRSWPRVAPVERTLDLRR